MVALKREATFGRPSKPAQFLTKWFRLILVIRPSWRGGSVAAMASQLSSDKKIAATLQARIDEQIEEVAKAVCEGGNVERQWRRLERLTRLLVSRM